MILFTGLGVYRLGASLLRPRWVNWILLPGTFVSEVGYIIGCLITGGEIRHAKILPDTGKGGSSDGEPTTEDTPRIKYLGRLVAALLSLILVVTAIVVLYTKLESPVIENFAEKLYFSGKDLQLPKELPDSMAGFWDTVRHQVDFLEGMCKSLQSLDWKNWRVPLFIYLTACLSIRLAPVGRDLRWALAAMVAISGVIALAGVISKKFDGLIKDDDIWHLLTYIWTLLLMLLAITGLIHAAVAFVKMMRGKGKSHHKARTSKNTAP